MKKLIALGTLVTVVSLAPRSARADLFGGDVAVLSQILINAIDQLAQLRQILNTGQDQVQLIRDINRGINDSLSLLRTIHPGTDPGLYRDWDKVQNALFAVERIYGAVAPSKNAQIEHDADQSVAEAITLNNSVYDYTRRIDDIGESIKDYSHQVSPAGAQKLTAESLGVMLHVLTQTLRTQSSGLKLQAQALAIQNSEEKERTRHVLESSSAMAEAMKTQDTSFTLPRF